MDPISLALLLGSFLAPAVGDLIGRALGSGDRAEADRLARQALAQFDGIQAPKLEDLIAKLPPSALEQIQPDAQAMGAQREALVDLQRMGRDQGGLELRAAMDTARRDVGQMAASRDAALRAEMTARGQGGGGQEYALRQMANQQAADRAAGMGFEGAMASRRAALQALQGGAQLAGQMRGQGFQEQESKARAADEIARFNALQRSQGAQQNFTNQMQLAGARSGAAGQGAAYYGNKAAGTQQQWGNYGQGVGAGVATIGQQRERETQREDDRQRWKEWMDLQGGKTT